MKLSISICVFFLILFINVNGNDYSNQNTRFDHITVKEGLANNRVDCMLQDFQGYLWFGTKRGLCRYNGYEFKTYRSQPNDSTSLRYHQITSLMESSDSTLWIAAWNGGLHIYNREKDNFIRVKMPERSSYEENISENNSINLIFEDSKRTIWIGNSQKLFIIENGDLQNISEIKAPDGYNSLPNVTTLYETSSGETIIASARFHKLFKYNPLSKKTSEFEIHLNNGPYPEITNQFYPFNNNILWLATNNGLISLDLKNREAHYVNENDSPAPGTELNFILQSQQDYLWIGGEGLFLFNRINGKFYRFESDPYDRGSIFGNIFTSGLKDKQNNLWFGTYSRGLNIVYNNLKKFNRNPELLKKLEEKSKNISAIYKAENGFLFMGTWDKGLFIADENNQFVHNSPEFNSLSHLTEKTIRSITSDNNGVIWIGTNDGYLTSFNLNTYSSSVYRIPAPSPGTELRSVTRIFIDSKDRYWIGSNFTLFLFDHSTASFYPYIDNINALDFEEDNEGNIWCASYNKGLCRINTDRTVNYFDLNDKELKIPSVKTITIHKDDKSRLWIGTEFTGLFLYMPDSNKFKQFTTNEGLPSNDICSIQEDRKGRLWIGTNNGLSRFNYSLRDFKNYFDSDGMDADEFHYNSNYADPSGTLYFGCTNGIVIFDPDDIRDDYLTYPVKIEELSINNGTVKKDQRGIPVEEALRKDAFLKLKYNQNTLSFAYATLNFSASKKSNYAYQLIGLDKKFNFVKEQRQVTYSNLKPGEYSFKVIASNNDNVWNEQGTELHFAIANPPWLKWWAIILYGFLLIAILYLFRYQIRHEEKMKNAIKLERIEKEQQKVLNKMKLQFFTNVSHEFKTPLTLIIGPLEQIISELHGNSALKVKLMNISANSKRLLELINQLINFRKIEQDVLPLVKTRNNLVETIQKTMTPFNSIAIDNEVHFELDTDFESMVFNYDIDKIEKIITNLLSNSFKYTPAGGYITVRIWKRKENVVCITVRDTGCGISNENMQKIFNGNYNNTQNGSGNFEIQSSGIGLSYSKKLAELHMGSLHIKSKKGKGTAVTIELPFDNKLPEKIENKAIIPEELSEKTFDDYTDESLIQTETKLSIVPRILIIEDDEELRGYIRSILIDRYKIDEAQDGKTGYDMAVKNDYDLIVSDIMMPNMNGIELCRKIKSNFKTSHIFIILLSAKSDVESKTEGYNTGADSYLTKPFIPKHLIRVINNLLTTRHQIKMFYNTAEGTENEPPGIHPRDKQFISDAIAIIEKNLNEEQFGVEKLGKEIGLSRTQLFRKFKSLTGKSPNDFIRQVRLRNAAKLIRERNYSISEIAYMVGFKTPANFSTSFKAFYGKSPKDYKGIN